MAIITASMIKMYEAMKEAKKILSEEATKRTGINDGLAFLDREMERRCGMGQIGSYKALQEAMQQQSQIVQQNMYGQGGLLAQQGIAGSLLGAGNLGLQNQPAMGKVVYPDGYKERIRRYGAEVAARFGFVWDFATDCFIHPSGASVTSRLIEDAERKDALITQIFKRALTPNMHWLDDRINEIRVKLC